MSLIRELSAIATLAKEVFEAIELGERGVWLLGCWLKREHSLDNPKSAPF
ncbi:MAG: hypothetical protein PUP92_38510 [Rhizonema sp. PD38]|nr:hypothetical protein [Rhizonema sp. PD38]